MLTAQDLKDITELDDLQLRTLAMDFFCTNNLCMRSILGVQMLGLDGDHLVLLVHFKSSAFRISAITIFVDVQMALFLQKIKRRIKNLIKLSKSGHNMLQIGYNKTITK